MQILIVTMLAGLVGFGIFSATLVVGIALAHYPFTLKDFANEIREIFKALYERDQTLKSKGEMNHGKHGNQ